MEFSTRNQCHGNLEEEALHFQHWTLSQAAELLILWMNQPFAGATEPENINVLVLLSIDVKFTNGSDDGAN